MAFDLRGALPDADGIGAFLRALVGYAAAPEVVTLVVQLTYLVTVLVLYLRPSRPRLSPATPQPVPAARP